MALLRGTTDLGQPPATGTFGKSWVTVGVTDFMYPNVPLRRRYYSLAQAGALVGAASKVNSAQNVFEAVDILFSFYESLSNDSIDPTVESWP